MSADLRNIGLAFGTAPISHLGPKLILLPVWVSPSWNFVSAVTWHCRSDFPCVGQPLKHNLSFGTALISQRGPELKLLPVWRPPFWTQTYFAISDKSVWILFSPASYNMMVRQFTFSLHNRYRQTYSYLHNTGNYFRVWPPFWIYLHEILPVINNFGL